MKKILLLLSLIALAFGCASRSAGTFDASGAGKEIPARVYDAAQDLVFTRAQEAAYALDWKVNSADKDQWTFFASTPATSYTWGDDVTVKVSKTADGKMRVDVLSRTALQVYDWGENKKNILDFYDKLDALMAAPLR